MAMRVCPNCGAALREGLGSAYISVCRDQRIPRRRQELPAQRTGGPARGAVLVDHALRPRDAHSAAYQPSVPDCQQPPESNPEPRWIIRHRHRSRPARRPARQLDRHRPGLPLSPATRARTTPTTVRPVERGSSLWRKTTPGCRGVWCALNTPIPGATLRARAASAPQISTPHLLRRVNEGLV
jgi:hypothetical protein